MISIVPTSCTMVLQRCRTGRKRRVQTLAILVEKTKVQICMSILTSRSLNESIAKIWGQSTPNRWNLTILLHLGTQKCDLAMALTKRIEALQISAQTCLLHQQSLSSRTNSLIKVHTMAVTEVTRISQTEIDLRFLKLKFVDFFKLIYSNLQVLTK